MSNNSDADEGIPDRRLMMQAMIGDMRRMMREELEPLRECVERVEEGQQAPN